MKKSIIVVLAAVIIAGAIWVGYNRRRHNQTSHNQMTFSGVGLELAVKHHQIFIANVLPDSPAAKGGLHGGLIIQEVNGTNVEHMPLKECVEMTRGPTGTTVQLEVMDTDNNQTNTIELTRETITVPVRQPPAKASPVIP